MRNTAVGILRTRRLVSAAAVVALGSTLAPGTAAYAGDGTASFVSRPDLTPPTITVTTPARNTSPGYLFISPETQGPAVQTGPMIVDNAGQPVWLDPAGSGQTVTDLRVQRYRGEPVLTWWQGTQAQGIGEGRYEVMDRFYHRVAEVGAGNGYVGDLHEFRLTPQGTALITIRHVIPYDLTPVGGPADGKVADGIVQEIDIATGKVLFEWHSLDHVGIQDSYASPSDPTNAGAFDYFHTNSVAPGPGGTLLISSRNTHTVYDVDRSTGAIIWRLGGKHSDFTMGPGTSFAWQHDAELQPNGDITLFDDEAAPQVGPESRALRLRLDHKAKTATLVKAYTTPLHLLAQHEGNTQVLPDGDVVVGWGSEPYYTEFGPAGDVRYTARFTADGLNTYRAYRFPWTGTPTDAPAAAARSAGGTTTVYASWNGATRIASWQLLTGPDAGHLSPAGTTARAGFETALPVTSAAASYARVRALDARGVPLGVSPVVNLAGASAVNLAGASASH